MQAQPISVTLSLATGPQHKNALPAALRASAVHDPPLLKEKSISTLPLKPLHVRECRVPPIQFSPPEGVTIAGVRTGAARPISHMERPCDAILLGAVGHPDIPDNVTLNGLLLPIRRTFDQFANVRPAVLYEAVGRRYSAACRKPAGLSALRSCSA